VVLVTALVVASFVACGGRPMVTCCAGPVPSTPTYRS